MTFRQPMAVFNAPFAGGFATTNLQTSASALSVSNFDADTLGVIAENRTIPIDRFSDSLENGNTIDICGTGNRRIGESP
jgi:hypothetical protein